MMKTTLAYILYYIGHFVSLTLLRVDILSCIVYPIYKRCMTWSSDLDKDNKVWQNPKNNDKI